MTSSLIIIIKGTFSVSSWQRNNCLSCCVISCQACGCVLAVTIMGVHCVTACLLFLPLFMATGSALYFKETISPLLRPD